MNNIVLAFDELAMNAAKCRALTVDDGAVAIGWQVMQGDCHCNVDGNWRPSDCVARTEGLRFALIERTVTGYCATVAYDWATSGLIARIRAPLEASRAETERFLQRNVGSMTEGSIRALKRPR